MKPITANDYLWDAGKVEIPAVCAVYGGDSFLKFQAIRAIRDHVLTDDDAEFSLSRFEGATVKIEQVLSEVSTRAMFGNGRRLVWIEDADPFLTKYRDILEDYVEKPATGGVLLLELQSFPSNTRMFKKLAEVGFLVDAAPLPEKEVPKWIVRWAKRQHKTVCEPDAAALLVDLAGAELGLLDQELAKLSLCVPPKSPITTEVVRQNVGSWRTQTTFEMLDLALSGKAAAAIRQLDNLLLAGENSIGILAQIAFSLRKFGAATQLIVDGEKTNQRISVAAALEKVGIKKFFVAKSEQQLKTLGRRRGEKLLQWLLQADLDLKGASRSDPRLILETLLIRLADPRLK